MHLLPLLLAALTGVMITAEPIPIPAPNPEPAEMGKADYPYTNRLFPGRCTGYQRPVEWCRGSLVATDLAHGSLW